MATKRMEHLAALGLSEEEQEEMRRVLDRMLGKYGESKRHPKHLRKELKARLGEISVSEMIIEAR